MKNRRPYFLLLLLGLVVFLTALLVLTYRSNGVKIRSGASKPSEIQRRNEILLRQLGHAYTLMEREEFSPAEKILKDILKTRPNHSMALQLLGQLFYRTERYSEAENVYRTMLKNNEFDAAAFNNLGQVLYRLGRHGEALQNLLKSKELNPGNMIVYINLSVVYAALNRQELARDMFMEAHRQLAEKKRSVEAVSAPLPERAP